MNTEAKRKPEPRTTGGPTKKTEGNIFTNGFFVTEYAGVTDDSVFDPTTRTYVPKEETRRPFSTQREILFRK